MNSKWIRLLLSALFMISAVYVPLTAEAKDKKDGILIIYTSTDGKETAEVKMLDLTAGHFSSAVTVKSDGDITTADLKKNRRVIYYGVTKKKLSTSFVSLISSMSQQLISIGYNAGQFRQFAGLSLTEKETVYRIYSKKEKTDMPLEKGMSVLGVSGVKGKPLYTYRSGDGGTRPFMWKTARSDYYFGVTSLLNDSFLTAKALRSAFGESAGGTLLYLRLEDISPMSDETLLYEAGSYLHKRHIPFILAVIPVYLNPENGEKVYLADKPKMVSVLKKLQQMGGSIIIHGYTHAYRYSETGEGFEFWDAKADQPITSENADDTPVKLEKEQDFPNEKAYRAYVKPFREKENIYTRTKLEQAIDDLTELGLYPLSFEAPHYTMSEEGYKIASSYFSSIFGQVQLSGTTWKTSGAPPFVSKPAMLDGMTLYPETIGYADNSKENPLGDMENHISQMIDFGGGVAGGFYHPYLGMKYLPELVNQMERIPGGEWLDLKKTKQTVTSDSVRIKTDGDGTIHVENKIHPITAFFNHHQQTPLEKALWILSGVVLLFIIMFACYVLYLRATLKKRIFKERRSLE